MGVESNLVSLGAVLAALLFFCLWLAERGHAKTYEKKYNRLLSQRLSNEAVGAIAVCIKKNRREIGVTIIKAPFLPPKVREELTDSGLLASDNTINIDHLRPVVAELHNHPGWPENISPETSRFSLF